MSAVRGLAVTIEAFRRRGILRLLRREEKEDALAKLKNQHIRGAIESFPPGFTMVWARARIQGRMTVLATIVGAAGELKLDIHWPLDSHLWLRAWWRSMFRRVLEEMVLLWMRRMTGGVAQEARGEIRRFAGALLRGLPLGREEGPAEFRPASHCEPYRWC